MSDYMDETIAYDYATIDEFMDDIEPEFIDYDPDYYSLRDEYSDPY